MRTPFLGPAYRSRSKNLADQLLINLYPEIVESKTGKAVGGFYMCPGLDLILTVGAGPVRGMHVMASNLFVVSGPQVWQFDMNFSAVFIGSISTSSGPVSMIDNGTQMNIFDGSNGYLVTAGVITLLSLPFTGSPVSAAYQDGFGLVNNSNTNQMYQSNLFDLSTYSALNFSSADATPDNIVAIIDYHHEFWLLKQNDTEVWDNAGTSGFALARNNGVAINQGCAAQFSPTNVGESMAWLSQNAEGTNVAVMASGYLVKRISTHAIEREWGTYSTTSDCIGFSYQQEGHQFVVFVFPAGNATWVYDVTASNLSGIPMWHQRASISQGVFSRHWANCYAFFNNKCLVGDYRNGNVYAFNLNAQLDNGTQRKWVRSWRALPQPTDKIVTFKSLRIDMETGGVDVPSGTNPQVVLQYSDDGGHTWSTEYFASAGPIGQTAQRVIYRRLGSTKKNQGLDRIFKLSSTDQMDVGLIGAELEAA